jgi:hypothetical protein
VRERSVRDHVQALSRDADLDGEALAPVLAVHDDRVEALVQLRLRATLARSRLARKDVVRGQHEWTPAWEQQPVDVLHREPLEVHDVGRARAAAVGEHVGDVLCELQRGPRARARGRGRARSGSIEQLLPHISIRGGRVAVGETRGEQRDVGACKSERRGELVVVRRRVRRGVD